MKYFVFFVFMIVSCFIFSQEEPKVKEVGEEGNKNAIFLTFGYTYIKEAAEVGATEVEGVFVPTIGLDYYYRLKPKLKIGMMLDLELANYLIISEDLERNKAFIVTAMAAYCLPENFSLYGGLGIELEKHENFAIFRLGAEYELELKKDWSLATGLFYDLKDGYDTWTLSLAVGKSF
jgi:hypothetical protein